MYSWFPTYRRLSLGFVSVVTLAAVLHLPRLQFDGNLDRLYAASGPEHELLDELHATFGRDDRSCFILLEADNLLVAESVQRIRQLHVALTELSGVRSVASLLDARRPKRVGRLWLPLFPGVEASQERFATARSEALTHPL